MQVVGQILSSLTPISLFLHEFGPVLVNIELDFACISFTSCTFVKIYCVYAQMFVIMAVIFLLCWFL